jgi:arabinan endo-1,5-alpha-L-arabinosidase
MKKFIPGFCITLFTILSLTACQQENKEEEATGSLEQDTTSNGYTNPVLNKNFPDPTVIKAHDGYYYVYGTNTSINGRTVNMQVAKSGDLVNWEHVGDALPNRPTWADRDFWAPHVLYDSANQTYYLYYSGESTSDAIGKCLGVATSKSPTGPFTDKGQPLLCGESFVNIDPMAYDDPATGKKLLYWGSGHEAIKVRELADDRKSFKEGSTTIELVQTIADESPDNYQRLVEGAWIVYRDGYYYMFYSGDNCCGDQAHYAVMVARAEQATGPFETMAEATGSGNSVILERNRRWIAPGHNSIITDDAGQDWMAYHAIDSINRDKGRVMLIDKVNYEDGWPQIEKGVPSLEEEQAPVVK